MASMMGRGEDGGGLGTSDGLIVGGVEHLKLPESSVAMDDNRPSLCEPANVMAWRSHPVE